LDVRADWADTGAGPTGLAFRGEIDPAHQAEFWSYDALGPRIWIHRDNERFPERPLVFVLEASPQQMEERRRRGSTSRPVAHRHDGELREVRVRGPDAPWLPEFAGPPVVCERGVHALELVVGEEGSVLSVSDGLAIR
jgi:hypothetical protein